MDKEKLKRFALDEFRKKVPRETAADETKLDEFIVKNIDVPLFDKLLEEFCAKNPDDFEVLNTFDFNDVEQNAKETLESIKYKQIINHAGLAYKKKSIDDALGELHSLVGPAEGPN
jgi:hypothetical protein